MLWSILLLMLYGHCVFAQDFCSTSSNIPDFLQTTLQSRFVEHINNSYVIQIFFHIIRQSNGIGGQTQTEVNTAFNVLNADYQSYGISFVLLGTDEILNDNYYNGNINFVCNSSTGVSDCDEDGKFDNFHPNSHPNAIDIYLFANDKLNYGLAANIPGSALVIGGNSYNINLASSHVLSHEMGHCLGLYHTFHGLCESGCLELVNGNNATTCGDFVADTPADPTRFNIDLNTCTWDGSTCSVSNKDANGDTYHPDLTLFMAYTSPNCMNHHTSGQVARMMAVIANSSILQNVLAPPPTISGTTNLCSGNYLFTVSNVPSGANITWTFLLQKQFHATQVEM